MKYQNKKTIEKCHPWKWVLLWTPVVLLLCILPFLVNYEMYESRLTEFVWSPSERWAVDFYLFCKRDFFLVISGIMFLFVVSLLGAYKKSGILSDYRTLRTKGMLLIGYFVLTLLSSLFSEYKWISFTGSDGQFESFFVIAGYMVTACYMVFLLRDNQHLTTVVYVLEIMMAGCVFLALLQFTKNNPMTWRWFQDLITPEGYLESGRTITSVFEKNRVYLFSYNPNYAGVLLALLAVFCFGTLLTEQSLKRRFIKAVLLVGLLVGLLGTGSKAGLLTFFVIAVLASLFVQRKAIRKKSAVLALSGVVLAAIAVILLFGSKLPLVREWKQFLSRDAKAENPLQEMFTGTDGVHFTYKDVPFSVSVSYEDGNFDFMVLEKDAVEIPLILSENREVYHLDREGLEDVTLSAGIVDDVLPLFSIRLNRREWTFIQMENQYYYLNQYRNLEELPRIERFGFHGYETLATNRGLIWSMTLPLLKDSVLLGSGVDTFACYYPQNNYKDLYYYTGDAAASSRPHNMYLKIAVESGMVSLLCLLLFWGWYIIGSVKLYWNCDFTRTSCRVGFACLLAVVVYLISGLTNDSMITVAPVFWCIQGVGLAANRISVRDADSRHGAGK